MFDHDYFALSEYRRKVVEYIGGYIVRAISKTLCCAGCVGLLISDTISSLLISIKDNGGLIEPSRFVHTAMHVAKKMLRQTSPVKEHRVQALTLKAFQEFVQQHKSMLQKCPHCTEDPRHSICLTRML